MSLVFEPYRALFSSLVTTPASWESNLQYELSELKVEREVELEPLQAENVREAKKVIKLL